MDTTIRPQPQVKLRRPGEFEPHAKTWMAWPHRQDLYGTRLAEALGLRMATVEALARLDHQGLIQATLSGTME